MDNPSLFTMALPDEGATQALATTLAGFCHKGDCLLLKGDLGTGKTTFARGFIRSLGSEEEVVSPTFTLVQTYLTRAGWPVWHFDLYRLEHAQELDPLGLEEALETGVTLIEWPELAKDRVPQEALTVQLAYEQEGQRKATLLGDTKVWKPRLEKLV